jgi:N,N'-diacetyllegionaminate synthase
MNDFYFFTETAFHHEGDLEYLKKLITASKESGVQGIKFQVLTNINDFVSSKHSAFNDLSSYCFSYEKWHEIFSFTKQIGLDIIMMPLNIDSLKLIKYFSIKYIEIHSVSFNDLVLHKEIKKTNLDLIIGVGGRTIDEIKEMQSYFENQLKVLMVGFQSFPSKLEDIKLGKIASLKNQFTNLEIGYSDHSSFDNEFAVLSNEYAYLLGARIFEKHITINEGEERIDFSAAVSGSRISTSIDRLNFLKKYVLLNEQEYLTFNEPELKYRNRQLICVANRNISKGEKITETDISMKLTDVLENTLSKPSMINGRTAIINITADSAILNNEIA